MDQSFKLRPEFQERLNKPYNLRSRWKALKKSRMTGQQEYFESATDFEIEQAIQNTVRQEDLPPNFDLDKLEKFIASKGF